ncbi:MAG: hypothetical protein WDN27_06010 [Candidatus Saccharibacteria bacterium]
MTDSVLYQGSDTQTINVGATTSFFRQQTTSGGNGDGGTIAGPIALAGRR